MFFWESRSFLRLSAKKTCSPHKILSAAKPPFIHAKIVKAPFYSSRVIFFQKNLLKNKAKKRWVNTLYSKELGRKRQQAVKGERLFFSKKKKE
jgi:hypothetical protein